MPGATPKIRVYREGLTIFSFRPKQIRSLVVSGSLPLVQRLFISQQYRPPAGWLDYSACRSNECLSTKCKAWCQKPMKFRFVLLGPDDPDRRDAEQSAETLSLYARKGSAMVRVEQLANGRSKTILLANFYACITRDIILDDGREQCRELGMEAEVAGKTISFTLSTTEFRRMDWVLNNLGPQAIIYPGQLQHVRAAIQFLSGSVRRERIYTHLGWQRDDSGWLYLQAGGAIGADGQRSDIRVQLPAGLRAYDVCPPDTSTKLVHDVRASLQLLSLAPDRITFPLLAGVYRAVLGRTDFSLFLAGSSGTFKTTLAALFQQHFGAGLDAANLPVSFASTGNALVEQAFHAKDAMCVVDDFAPTRQYDRELEAIAERLFRAVGNYQGRRRLSGNGRLQEAKAPRALVLATGEQVPQGQSIRARLLVLEVASGDIDVTRISECQEAGRQGLFAEAMGGYLRWLASRYEGVLECLRARVKELRNQGEGRQVHARLPSVLAELRTGWEIFLEFALDAGAINATEKQQLEARNQAALAQAGVLQAKYQESMDPAMRFLLTLRAVLTCGHAHVADKRGGAPPDAGRWGWVTAGRIWKGQGTRIGWVAGTELYLDSNASYRVFMEGVGHSRMTPSEQALRHRLRERGLLASLDAGRGMVQVRRTLEGKPRLVLHLKSSSLVNA